MDTYGDQDAPASPDMEINPPASPVVYGVNDTPASPEYHHYQSDPEPDQDQHRGPRSPPQSPDLHYEMVSPQPPASPDYVRPESADSSGFRNGPRSPHSIPPQSPIDDRLYRSNESSPPPPASPEPVIMDHESLIAVSDDEGELPPAPAQEFRGHTPPLQPVEVPQPTKKRGALSSSSSSSSSDEEETEVNPKTGRRDPKKRLSNLKNMRFKRSGKSFIGGEQDEQQQQRTVRSFLHEKGAEDYEILTTTSSTTTVTKTRRQRSVTPEDEKPKRKRRYEDDERQEKKEKPPVKEIQHTPAQLMQKIHTFIAKAEQPGNDIADDDLLDTVFEVMLLDRELKELFDKRAILTEEMNGFANNEKDLIKQIHSELPIHMQSVLKIDGDNVAINDAPVLNAPPPGMPPFPFPPGMFPSIPSLLGKGGMPTMPPGMPPFPPGMQIPPGMPPFPFPGMTFPPTGPPPVMTTTIVSTTQRETERLQSISPDPVEATPREPKTPPPQAEPVMFPANFNLPPPSMSMAPPTSTMLTQQTSSSMTVHDFSKPPPLGMVGGIPTGLTSNSSASSLPDLAKPPPGMNAPPPHAFNVPPPNMGNYGGEDKGVSSTSFSSSSVSLMSNVKANVAPTATLTAPVTMDLSKTITSLITNALKGSQKQPGQQFGSPMKSYLGSNMDMAGSSRDRNGPSPAKSRPPPSLMSLSTSDPFHIGTVRIGYTGDKKTPNRNRGGRHNKKDSSPRSPRTPRT